MTTRIFRALALLLSMAAGQPAFAEEAAPAAVTIVGAEFGVIDNLFYEQDSVVTTALMRLMEQALAAADWGLVVAPAAAEPDAGKPGVLN